MRALLAAILLAGCHDYSHFHSAPDGFAADLAVADLVAGGNADLAGCPTPGAPPVPTAGCSVYTFESGLPAALTTFIGRVDATIEPSCGMMHVHLPAGTTHDLWIDDLGAVRIEEKTPRTGPFLLSARVHGALDLVQKFSGLYATDGNGRFISIQTSTDSTGLNDHDVVFSVGAASAEQASYPTALPAAGDSYAYQLERLATLNQFRLQGSTEQTLTVTAPTSLTPGVVVGNCCAGTAPGFEAWIEWMMVCP